MHLYLSNCLWRLGMGFLLSASLIYGSCVSSSGSYNSASAYHPHLEKTGTGQAFIQVSPNLSGSAVGGYALTNRIYGQGELQLATPVSGSFASKPRLSGQVLGGLYLFRDGYQSLTFGLGVGAGNTEFVKRGVVLGRFNYNHLVAQAGISENYGSTRMSLGLQVRLINLYQGRVFLTADQDAAGRIDQLTRSRFVPAYSMHMGISTRIARKVRLFSAYNFTFSTKDYRLFDRDVLTGGVMLDLGKLSIPVKPPRPPRVKRTPSQRRKNTKNTPKAKKKVLDQDTE
jgi:hypothetical protein